jgi:hypothetical protein
MRPGRGKRICPDPYRFELLKGGAELALPRKERRLRPRHFLFLLVISVSFSSCIFDCDNTQTPEPEFELTPATLIYPGSASHDIGRSPIFIWDGHLEDDTDGSYEFTVRVWRSLSSEEWTIPAGSDTVIQLPDTLDSETTYTWRVITEGSGGRSEDGSANAFTTGTGFNNPPTNFRNRIPSFESLEVPVPVDFSWFCQDPDGDPLVFDLSYWRDGDTDSTHITSLVTFDHTAPLDADTRYQWRVTARDNRGGTTSSYSIPFTTISTPPPHDPFPVDGAADIPLDLTMSWSCEDPDGDELVYDVEMGYAGSGMSLIAVGIAQDELPVTGLAEGRTFEWRVTAEDDDGHRTEGPVWSFMTVGAPGDVFADLTLTRRQTFVSELTRIDMIWARFDADYAPQYALRPLQPDAVTCGGYDLEWVSANYRYYYENAHTLFFLDPGTEYAFTVTGGDGVPAYTGSILFPECAPVITSPAPFDLVSLDGFEVTWSGYDGFPDCARQVSIAILDIMGDSTGVYVTTENDGSYTFTAAQLSVIDPSMFDMQIVLIVENVENIDAPGYDPRSWIRARTLSAQTVYRE